MKQLHTGLIEVEMQRKEFVSSTVFFFFFRTISIFFRAINVLLYSYLFATK